MYRFFIFFLFFSISLFAEILNFDFFETNDKSHYNSTTLNQDIQKEFGSEFQISSLILIQADSEQNKYFKMQNKILDNASHDTMEKLATIIVISLQDNIYQSGYHTSIGTACRLSNNGLKNFQITILSANGKILKRSNNIMNIQEISKTILSQKKYIHETK